MPFFVAHDPREHTPGYVEVWATPFPTRAAAEEALRTRAEENAAFLPAAYLIIEAGNYRAAIEQMRAQVRGWSR